MRCANCGGELVAKKADLPFQLHETEMVTLRGMSMLRCRACGEILFTEAELQELDRRLDDLERNGTGGLTWEEMEAKAWGQTE
jgi:YgiT-type zinc finger domain-containing protein